MLRRVIDRLFIISAVNGNYCELNETPELHQLAVKVTKKEDKFKYSLRVENKYNAQIYFIDSASNLYLVQLSPYESQAAYALYEKGVSPRALRRRSLPRARPASL